MKVNEKAEVHGVSTLFSIEDAEKLDKQEGGYDIKVFSVRLYPGETLDGSDTIDVEVYVPKEPLDPEHPSGACSSRYRDVLVNGATSSKLSDDWLAKWVDGREGVGVVSPWHLHSTIHPRPHRLKALPVYQPSALTLAVRAAVPRPEAMREMALAELSEHDGKHEGKDVFCSSLGYGGSTSPSLSFSRPTQSFLLHHNCSLQAQGVFLRLSRPRLHQPQHDAQAGYESREARQRLCRTRSYRGRVRVELCGRTEIDYDIASSTCETAS